MAVVVAAGLLVVAGLVALWWRQRRARPPSGAVPPQAQARRALAGLRGRAEDAQVAAEVSQVLRQYVRAVLGLPAGQWTTAELGAALRQHPQTNSELADALVELLRDCDAVKFAPVPPAAPLDLAARALGLIDWLERERRGVLAAGGLEPNPPSRS